MPINIYSQEHDSPKRVAWLCDVNWRLPDQAEALEAWLIEKSVTLKPGRYIADIGFTPRQDALGGGASLSPEMMRTMADLGMSLFLSEYPSDEDGAANWGSSHLRTSEPVANDSPKALPTKTGDPVV